MCEVLAFSAAAFSRIFAMVDLVISDEVVEGKALLAEEGFAAEPTVALLFFNCENNEIPRFEHNENINREWTKFCTHLPFPSTLLT